MTTDSRERVLELLRSGGHTATSLAQALGVTSVAARRHLCDLKEQGLAQAEEERHGGRGRPQQVYRLTPAGREQFAGDYATLCLDLLSAAKACYGPAAVTQLIRERNAGLRRQWSAELGTLQGAARLKALAELLSEAGYDARVERQGNTVVLVQHSCPHLALARQHPEVCAAEQALYHELLPGATVHSCSRIAAGCCSCRYQVQLP